MNSAERNQRIDEMEQEIRDKYEEITSRKSTQIEDDADVFGSIGYDLESLKEQVKQVTQVTSELKNDQVLVDISHALSGVENQAKQLTSAMQALEHEMKYLKEQLRWAKRRADQQSKELIGTMARLNKLEQWQLLQGSKAE